MSPVGDPPVGDHPVGDPSVDAETLISRLEPFTNPLFSYKGLGGVLGLTAYRFSAVLIPLFIDRHGVPHVLLTKRSSTLRNHAGEVAFPGGMQDAGDATEVETALREAEEEVGLLPDDVRVVTRLPPRLSKNNILICPIVGIIPNDFVPKLNKAEVESVFCVPLPRFLSNDDHEVGTFVIRPGKVATFHIFTDTIDNQTYLTWGLTASIITEVAIAVMQRKPNFVYATDIDVTPENPFSAQLLYLRKYLNFPSLSHL